ncbi:MAG: hypothetical protein JW908_01230 [Anaerolineales bacterium]|nr:hypothetical protein [Anaerolineales bacterium]
MNSLLNLFPLLAIFWLLITASIILLIRLIREKFAYYWLLSTFGILVGWVLILFSRSGLPYVQNPAGLLPGAEKIGLPSLLIDGLSWPYALVLITLAMVVYLSLVVNASQMDWLSLGGGLVLTAFGLLAIHARDATTIRTSWAVIDIVEFSLLFARIRDRHRINSLLSAFALRLIGIILFLWGTSDTNVLLLAAGIRLFVIPAGSLSEDTLNLPRCMIYFLTLISPLSALIVFSRIAVTIDITALNIFLFIAVVSIGVIAGLAWFTARNEFEGRRYWVFILSSFVILAAMRGLVIASAVWGFAMILSGGILFFEEKFIRKPIFLYVGLLAITSIPFTPTWDGASLYSTEPGISMVILILVQSLLVGGYLKHTSKSRSQIETSERWVLLLNPLRLVIIVGVYWLLAFLYWRDGVLLLNSTPWLLHKNIIDYFVGFIIGAAGLVIYLSWRNQHRFPSWIKHIKINWAFSDWLTKSGHRIFRLFGRFTYGLSAVVEGESGILLTLLLLALLITFFLQGS